MEREENRISLSMHQRDIVSESRVSRMMDIFSAITTNRVDLVEARIAEGVDVNSISDEFYGRSTPLEMACQYSRLDIIDILIINGAIVSINTIRSMLNDRHKYYSIKLWKTFKLMIDYGVSVEEFIQCFSLSASTRIPNSYIELVSLLRSFDPNFFNIFPLSSDEEFISLVEIHEDETSNSFIEYYRIHMTSNVENQGYEVVSANSLFDVISRQIIDNNSMSIREDFINYLNLLRPPNYQEEYLDSMMLFAIQSRIDTSIIQELANFFSINIFLYGSLEEDPVMFESSPNNIEIRFFVAGNEYYSVILPEINVLMGEISLDSPNYTNHAMGNEESLSGLVGAVAEDYSS